ncbi:MAG: carbohydrate-binding domain-containing protein [Eubacteriales bacterium]
MKATVIIMKRVTSIILILMLTLLLLTSCVMQNDGSQQSEQYTESDTQEPIESNSLVFDGNKYTYTGEKDSIDFDSFAITVKKGGTYVLSGTLDDGQIAVDTGSDEEVTLIFEGLCASCSFSCPIYIKKCGKVNLVISEKTRNILKDGRKYDDKDPNIEYGCIYSTSDINISGNGELIINANYANGISCLGTLRIISGGINVNAADNALYATDRIEVEDGSVNVINALSALVCDGTESELSGCILIKGGFFGITCEEAALRASKSITVSGGSAVVNTPEKPYVCTHNDENGEIVSGIIQVDAINGWPAAT